MHSRHSLRFSLASSLSVMGLEFSGPGFTAAAAGPLSALLLVVVSGFSCGCSECLISARFLGRQISHMPRPTATTMMPKIAASFMAESQIRKLTQGGWVKFGRLEPTKTVAKSGPPPPPMDMDSVGMSSCAAAISACAKAARKASTESAAENLVGTNTPQIKFTEYVLADIAICQCAFSKRPIIWAANPCDSGSLAIHAITTLPGCEGSPSANFWRCFSVNCRHAAAFIISAVRLFASEASFSRAAARSLWSPNSLLSAVSLIFPETTIAYVAATPTISAATSTQLAQENLYQQTP